MSDERVDRIASIVYDAMPDDPFTKPMTSDGFELPYAYAYDYAATHYPDRIAAKKARETARKIVAALDEAPDHFYLATFKDVDDSQVTDTEPQYRRVYTIVGGAESSVLDARDSGWLSDEEWGRAVVLGFKGTRALAAYHDMESDEPTEDALDAESAQDALYERVSHPALDEEPPQRQEISVHCDQCGGQWFWPTFNGELHLQTCHEHSDPPERDDGYTGPRVYVGGSEIRPFRDIVDNDDA